MARDDEPRPNPFDQPTPEEKDKLIKARLFQTHKAHNSLSIFDQLYPELEAYGRWMSRQRNDGGRER